MKSDMDAAIAQTAGGVTLKMYVAPRASANKVVGLHNGALKIALTAPPVDGAANRALVEFLAKMLGVPKQAVSVVSGEASRQKVALVVGLDAEEVRAKLASA